MTELEGAEDYSWLRRRRSHRARLASGLLVAVVYVPIGVLTVVGLLDGEWTPAWLWMLAVPALVLGPIVGSVFWISRDPEIRNKSLLW